MTFCTEDLFFILRNKEKKRNKEMKKKKLKKKLEKEKLLPLKFLLAPPLKNSFLSTCLALHEKSKSFLNLSEAAAC